MMKKFYRLICGAARVATLAGTLLAATLAWGYHSAHAQVSEALSGFGQELMAWDQARPISGLRRLYLNGANIELLSTEFMQPLPKALDRFEQECRQAGGLQIPRALAASLGLEAGGIYRQESDDEGVIACLDTGGTLSAKELLERVQRFAETGDLNAVGQLRYAFARSSSDGSKTTVLALWTEASLPLKAMFPESGDAPGIDPKGVPRLPKSRRLLSAEESGQTYAVTIYESNQEADLLRWYTSSLQGAGWAVSKTSLNTVLSATRGDQVILIRADQKSGKVGIVELS